MSRSAGAFFLFLAATLALAMRLYAPDLEKFKTWTPPKAEKIK